MFDVINQEFIVFSKCSLNISQTSPVGELSKAHHHELVTAIELDGVPMQRSIREAVLARLSVMFSATLRPKQPGRPQCQRERHRPKSSAL